MESTSYPQLIQIAVIILTLAANITMTVVCIRAAVSIKARLSELATLQLDVADLHDRFVGFQKRDGMRKVRQERTHQQDVVAELQTLAAGAPTQPAADTKAALRRKLRGH